MLQLLAYLVLAPHLYASAPACECLCVDGAPLTLCSDFIAADKDPHLCSPAKACALPAQQPPEVYEQLDPPVEGASNCRWVEVWHDNYSDRRRIKICDTWPG